ncbi:hypothetical protein KXQ82_08985 [Mucilaginibacter sp. HMF5004]|uniref:hypothetical protein n=1 Tax=Mucilaginibacter rivuli TaxID=2857527 RepID=UPI001C5F28CE|nr:hypothetical protein [Mucilaginibacter rivuli]MBW4889849.1 hypothetical protein [Mucilaginibacter rivuli]
MASADQVEFIAVQLLPQFIPKDDKAVTLTFQFTMVPNTTYRVNFVKKVSGGKADWQLSGYEEVVP